MTFKPRRGLGDDGDTIVSIIRLPKYHACIHYVGSVDEAMAFVGLAIELCRVDAVKDRLTYVYNVLSRIAGALHTNWCPSSNDVSEVEKVMDSLPKPSNFIPNYVKNPRFGGVAPVAIARTVIRRAERWFWQCHNETGLGCRNIGILLNRLSDLVFLIQYQILLLESSDQILSSHPPKHVDAYLR